MSFTPNLIRQYMAPHSDASSLGGTGMSANALDFTIPKDNLYAFGKLWFSFDDEPCIAAFHGLNFGMVGNQRFKAVIWLQWFWYVPVKVA